MSEDYKKLFFQSTAFKFTYIAGQAIKSFVCLEEINSLKPLAFGCHNKFKKPNKSSRVRTSRADVKSSSLQSFNEFQRTHQSKLQSSFSNLPLQYIFNPTIKASTLQYLNGFTFQISTRFFKPQRTKRTVSLYQIYGRSFVFTNVAISNDNILYITSNCWQLLFDDSINCDSRFVTDEYSLTLYSNSHNNILVFSTDRLRCIILNVSFIQSAELKVASELKTFINLLEVLLYVHAIFVFIVIIN